MVKKRRTEVGKRGVLEVDLHGMYVKDAEKYLKAQIDNAPSEVKEILVIHGYTEGQQLLKMVREDFYSGKVKQKAPSLMNPGSTRLFL